MELDVLTDSSVSPSENAAYFGTSRGYNEAQLLRNYCETWSSGSYDLPLEPSESSFVSAWSWQWGAYPCLVPVIMSFYR